MILDRIDSKLSFFADDANVMRVVNGKDEANLLQQDLDLMSEWTRQWDMSFNIDKCQIMHFGYGNQSAHYNLLGQKVCSSNRVKDLGVNICDNLKFSTHCSDISKRANKLLGFIKASVSSRHRDVILSLYKGLIRPYM